jgi:hypothetical protein
LTGATLAGANLDCARFGDDAIGDDGKPLKSVLSTREAQKAPSLDELSAASWTTLRIGGQIHQR